MNNHYTERQGLDRFAVDLDNVRIHQAQYQHQSDWHGAYGWCLKYRDYDAAHLIRMLNDEQYAAKHVAKKSCDACGELKPKAGFKTAEVYGCEGDFCHDCRHGKGCDCGADDEE